MTPEALLIALFSAAAKLLSKDEARLAANYTPYLLLRSTGPMLL